jgi:hypothetical protein
MAPTADFVWALGPAAAVAAVSLVRAQAPDADARSVRMRLWLWAGAVSLLILLRPVPFTQQFVIGAGLPVLILAALALAPARPMVLAFSIVAFAATAVVALRVVSRSEQHWHIGAERREAALALRESCRPGGLALAPPDIGLYTIGLTACRAFVSHPWAPAHAERAAAVKAFYGGMPAAERRALLDRFRVTHIALPGDAGPVGASWLGEDSPFRRLAEVGRPPATISLYARGVRAAAPDSGR